MLLMLVLSHVLLLRNPPLTGLQWIVTVFAVELLLRPSASEKVKIGRKKRL